MAALRRRLARRTALYLGVAVICLVALFPSYWMLLTAIQNEKYHFTYPPYLIPQVIDLGAFVQLFQEKPMAAWLANTVTVSAGTTVLTFFLTVIGAYGLSRFRFRGRSACAFLILATQMLPEALLVIPVFVLFKRAMLIDNLGSLVLMDTAFAVPVTLWVLKGFFDTIPVEIEEAALVDGCSRMGVLWRVTLPLSLPALVAVSVIAFFDGWNEYLFASTLITNQNHWVVTTGLASFIAWLTTPLEQVMAGAVTFVVPPVAFYLIMQRYIISGLTGGAVKG